MSTVISKLPIFKLQDISTYRSELMGWSIIWIMMLHFRFENISQIGFIAQYGFTGVDIFLLVSGLGLYYSLDKDSRLLPFYRKRLLRIFPTYYLLGIFASLLLFHDGILSYLFRYTTIGFWTGGIFWGWYVPSIMVLYLAAPFLKMLFDKGQAWLIGVLAIVILCVSHYLVATEAFQPKDQHFFFIYRIPAFLFGMLCGYWLKNGIQATKYFYIIMLAGIPLFALLLPHHHQVYNYKYFALAFIMPFFVWCICLVSRWLKHVNPPMRLIGNASLEIYLIQGIFFHAINMGLITVSDQWHDAVTVGLILLCSLLGIAVHWAIDKSGINRFPRVKNSNGKA